MLFTLLLSFPLIPGSFSFAFKKCVFLYFWTNKQREVNSWLNKICISSRDKEEKKGKLAQTLSLADKMLEQRIFCQVIHSYHYTLTYVHCEHGYVRVCALLVFFMLLIKDNAPCQRV